MPINQPGSSTNLASPGPIGGTTPAAITGTTIAGAKFVPAAGTAGAPSIANPADATTGIYFAGSGEMDITVGGGQKLAISAGSVFSNLPFYGPSGSAGSPAFGYNVDGSGMFFLTGAVILSSGATEKARFSATGTRLVLPTSSAGLVSGDLWNNSGIVTIV